MTKEKANKIVDLISRIAEGEASIRLNSFCENSDAVNHNRKLVEKWKQNLVELLSVNE